MTKYTIYEVKWYDDEVRYRYLSVDAIYSQFVITDISLFIIITLARFLNNKIKHVNNNYHYPKV